MTVPSKLHILGSSSSGNGYILEVGKDILIIECGFRLRDVYRKIGFEANRIKGVIVSHSHGDHAKYISEYIQQGFPIMCPDNLIDEYKINISQRINEDNPFVVVPFNLEHDVPCYGYLIYHKDFGKIVFATDTFAIPCEFSDVRLAMIEANYSDQILKQNLRSGEVHMSHGLRIIRSHMEINYSIRALQRIKNLERVLLIHLSSQNSNADEFQKTVKSELGVPVDVAQANMTLTL